MDTAEIYQESIRHFLKPILGLLDDPNVSDILINGIDQIYYEKQGKLHLFEKHFDSEQKLMAAARNIAEFSNRHLDNHEHSIDARLPDGSRVHIIVPPSSRQGVCISIRKFKKSSFNLDSLVQFGSITSEVAEFCKIIIALHKNIIVSGGTGTGKTSLLNALSTAISSDERIIVIEDSSELQLKQPHTVYLEAQSPTPDGFPGVSIRDLFVDSLRMRPDRIVVGEIRRGEALDLIQAMISGHEGSLTTVHANTPQDAAVRLETLCAMGNVSMPVLVARIQVASAIHIVIQTSRFSDGSRHVTQISECLNLSQNQYLFKDIYRYTRQGMDKNGKIIGTMERTGYSPSFATAPYRYGLGNLVQETQGVFRKEEH